MIERERKCEMNRENSVLQRLYVSECEVMAEHLRMDKEYQQQIETDSGLSRNLRNELSQDLLQQLDEYLQRSDDVNEYLQEVYFKHGIIVGDRLMIEILGDGEESLQKLMK